MKRTCAHPHDKNYTLIHYFLSPENRQHNSAAIVEYNPGASKNAATTPTDATQAEATEDGSLSAISPGVEITHETVVTAGERAASEICPFTSLDLVEHVSLGIYALLRISSGISLLMGMPVFRR